MELPKAEGAPASFMQQMKQNNMLLLTVFMAVSATAYFVIGLYILLRH